MHPANSSEDVTHGSSQAQLTASKRRISAKLQLHLAFHISSDASFSKADSVHCCGSTNAVIRLVLSALVGVATVILLVYDIRSRRAEQDQTHIHTSDSVHCRGSTEAVIRLVLSALVGVATVILLVYDIRSRKAEQDQTHIHTSGSTET
ncbi:hypothetical protein G5714_021346 [Onychostoma macrolepis]|uniref:Transmembrane protein n=1 Tax=Onychostoma macrolepis TaxID=369639 RepID=A0A7J6BQQ1_9TELE|nr:hypothetical protein G5714_021346 [Onychostoma macrolepis]